MTNPILKEWADLATQSFPEEFRSSGWRRREQAKSLFYAGAGVVLQGVVEAMGSGDPAELVRYLTAAKDDLAAYAEDTMKATGVKS